MAISAIREKFLANPPQWLTLARLKWLVVLLLLLWIASQWANLFWLTLNTFLRTDNPAQNTQAALVNVELKESISMSDLDKIKIFGEGATDTVGVVEQPVGVPLDPSKIPNDAPRSSLPLTLTGVISAGDSIISTAMILFQATEENYHLDDKLPPNNQASIVRILPDRVIIYNMGRYESLMLYNEDMMLSQQQNVVASKQGAGEGNNANVIDKRKDPAAIEAVKQFKEMVDRKDAQALTKMMNVTIAQNSDGSIKGYKVFPGQNTQVFDAIGLQRGDIISSINGISLDNPQRAASMMSELSVTNEMDLTVERGGNTVSIKVSL